MKAKSKKNLLIIIGALVAAACVAVSAIFVIGNLTGKNGYTVKFELCTDLQTTAVLDRTVAPGSFLEEPEVYVTGDNKENWSISGWYTEPEYELQWDFDFDTVESNLTLYAKWEAKPECTVSFYAEESAEPVYITKVRKGLVTTRCDAEFIGREVLGYYTDKAMTKEFDFETKIEKDTDIYVELSDYIYFNAKTLAKWNLCGNQSEATKYKMSTSLSTDETVYTVTSKDGGYLWLSNLSLLMNGTSIIEIKAREINDNSSGVIGGYITGEYNIDGELGGSSDFGQTNTGALIYGRNAKPDEEGFYTYTYNISNLTPGLVYDKMTGIRIDFYGTDTYTYEIKEIKTYVDEYAVSGAAFKANGIDFNGLHLNTFALMGGAETEMLANGDLRFGGPDGAFIFKKDIEITLGDQQLIRLKAKGDLKGGAIALFFYGDYVLNGKAGTTTDYTSKHMVYFNPVSTDSSGYTIYTADISSISGLKYKVIRGLRLDLYGEGTRTIDIQSMKSYAPSQEELEVKKDFEATGLNFTGVHLSQFLSYADAKTERLSNGNLKVSGPDGAMIYKKDMKIKLENEQLITLKAKGDIKGGAIGLYLYGDYTKNGVPGTIDDFSSKHMWIMEAGETDAEGYTTYTANIGSISGLKYDVVRGLRLDLYGNGTREIEIASLKSSVPQVEEGGSGEEDEDKISFKMNGLNLTGTHLNQFLKEGSAQTELIGNGDMRFGGPDSAFIYKKDMEISLGEEQLITIKAKGDLQGGAIGIYLFGDYTMNGTPGTLEDYGPHMWIAQVGDVDADGYTAYTIDISSILGLKYNVIRGMRLDLYGSGTRTIEIASVKSSVPESQGGSGEEEEDSFKMNGLNLTGTHLSQFLQEGSAQTELLGNGDLKFSGPDSAFIYKKDMEVTLSDDQLITLKAKGNLQGGIIGLFMYGDYTLNGNAGTKTDYDAEHMWIMQAGETDADGYTTYTVNISSISGLKYDVIRGMRLDLYGSGTRTLEIASVKSSVPESQGGSGGEEEDPFKMNGLNLTGTHLEQFLKEGSAQTELLGNGDLKFSGPDSAFIYKKDMEATLGDDQLITLKAKGNLQGGIIGLFMYGDYTLNGNAGSKTDFDAEHMWIMQAGETDADGYTAYTVNISSVAGLKYDVIRGMRLDLYGSGTRTIEIASVKSSVPESQGGSGGEEEDPFKMNGLNLTGTHLEQFLKEGSAQTELLGNGDLKFSGPDSAFIYKKGMEVTLGNEQLITLKAKGDLKGGAIGVYLFGDYTMNGTPGTLDDYGAHMWSVQVGEVDADGYTTYTIDISSILGLKYEVIRGMRIDLYGSQTVSIEIQSVQSKEKGSTANIILNPEDLNEFEPLNGASKKLNADGTFHMEGTDGAFVHKTGLNIDVTDRQKIVMKAKVTSGATIGAYVFGEFTKAGQPTTINDYDENYVWIMEAGETDAEGYTTYSIDLRTTAASITNLQWKTMQGFRVEIWGNGTHSLDIKEIEAVPVS